MTLPYEFWEPVIGLEIHAQLNTQSKLFSSAPNLFGCEPNTNISVTCTGQPGALPILNRAAVRKAVQFGLAIGAKIAHVSTFDRKSYTYPDSPRNFQITQYENPLIRGGSITTEVGGESKTFFIDRAHIEDDAGMLRHFTNFTGIDYNRAGAPLIEIVSEPCMHSAQEASAYASAVREILLYLDACDGNMEEGSLRIDVNISVRPKGETGLRPRVEIKNMNSFSFLEMAINHEITRQIALYTAHPDKEPLALIPPGTYRWDTEHQQTLLMRKKESADDYRYFPEPDLMPLILEQSDLDELLAKLPELPRQRHMRYVSTLGLSPYAASTLTSDKFLSDYFEEANALCNNPRSVCNWITIEFAGRLKALGKTLSSIAIPPRHIAKLIHLIDTHAITGRIAKDVADAMVQSPELDPEEIVRKNPDYQPMEDNDALDALIDTVLAANAQSITDFKAGKERAFGFLVGQIMKETKGKADPKRVNELLQKKIGRYTQRNQ